MAKQTSLGMLKNCRQRRQHGQPALGLGEDLQRLVKVDGGPQVVVTTADGYLQLAGKRILVGKPGLDGHSNGAEQIAVAARDAGMEVIYQGIRLTPAQIAAVARDEDVDVVGLSMLSGAHMTLAPLVVEAIRARGVDIPVVIGGIVPNSDVAELKAAGIAEILGPGAPADEVVAAVRRAAANAAV